MAQLLDRVRRLLRELKRRNVYRVTAVYLVAAFVVLQLAGLAADAFALPGWFEPMVWVLVGLGLPVAAVLAWAFELTPEGMRRTPEPEGAGGEGQGGPPAGTGAGPIRWLGAGLATVAAAGALYLLAGPPGGAGGPASGPRGAERETAAAAPARVSVAVLPFESMSAEPGDEYFADGITEELLNRLAQIERLQVPARTSSFALEGASLPVEAIADSLGVAHVLEGSVRRSGERVRITAQLVDGRSGYHLWSKSYDRRLEDVFAVQAEIARSVAGALEVELLGEEAARIDRRPTADPAAHDAYLLGLQRLNVRDTDAALRYFRRAVRLDSAYATAWAGLAQALYLATIYEPGVDPRSYGARAKEAARRALALAPELPEAHAALGGILYQLEWDFGAAERELRRAVELRPGYATARQWLAEVLVLTGRHEEGLRQVDRALASDPLSPSVTFFSGALREFARRWDEAIRRERRALEMFSAGPAKAGFRAWTATTLATVGRLEEARAALEDVEATAGRLETGRARRLWADVARAGQAVVEALEGEIAPDSARRTVAGFAGRGGVGDLEARFLALLGVRDRTIGLMRGWQREGSPYVPWLTLPVFDRLRDDPRYRSLLEEVGLPLNEGDSWLSRRQERATGR